MSTLWPQLAQAQPLPSYLQCSMNPVSKDALLGTCYVSPQKAKTTGSFRVKKHNFREHFLARIQGPSRGLIWPAVNLSVKTPLFLGQEP